MKRDETNVFRNRDSRIDLSNFRILWSGIDTIKYLVHCQLINSVFDRVVSHYQNHPDLPIHIGSREYIIIKSAKVSGFQYILKNLDVGITVLLKHFYTPVDDSATHLKIECSPHLICSMKTAKSQFNDELDELIYDVVFDFALNPVLQPPSVHFAIDFQGYSLPYDLPRKLVTKAKRFYQHNCTSSIDMSSFSTVHGNFETFTFGDPSSLQASFYLKSKEMFSSHKSDFMQSLWSTVPDVESAGYNSDEDVTRIEFRLHQSVVAQFSHGTKDEKGKSLQIVNRASFLEHINAIFRYCLNQFRYQHSTSYVHPLWTLLEQDVQFSHFDYDFDYKRSYDKKPSGYKKNIALWLGNLISIKARKSKFTTAQDILDIVSASGLADDFYWYWSNLSTSDTENDLNIHEYLQNKIDKYRLDGAHI